MISPEQLAAALERLDPRDRELLSLSLRRRVPDDALARMYDVEPPEVARRRAGAIERLADELGIQRGEDLGRVLQTLLEKDVWSARGPVRGPGEEFSDESRRNALPDAAAEAPTPRRVRPTVVPVASDPALERVAGPEGVEARAQPEGGRVAAGAEPHGATAASGPGPGVESERPREAAPSRFPRLAVALFATGIAALAAAAGLFGATQFGGDGQASEGGSGTGDGTRQFVPDQSGPMAAPFPSEPQTVACHSTAYVRQRSTLYRRPGGRPRLRVTARTEWGSPRVFGVVRREGDWLAVQAPELENGEVAWLPARKARLDCVRWSLHADLSKRRLVVREDGRTTRALSVAIGRAGNATPQGRFSVTDRLRVTDGESSYGCCVLALTGHQTDLPPDWPGGDRLAIHATRDLASIGRPTSLGCLRARAQQARWLIETIPLGTPIFIRS